MRTRQPNNPQGQSQTTQHRAGDWKCVICYNINFSFRNECNRCGLISKEQNDHHNTMLAYGGVETAGLPYFLTPVRRKDKTDIMDRSPDGCLAEVTKTNGLLSVSPVLRQLGL